MDSSEKTSPNRLCFTHWAVLACGCLAGVVVAALVSSLPIDFSAEIAEAKRLGIASKTILAGYPKSRDVLLYAAFILLPVTFSLGAWLVWSRGRRAELALLFRSRSTAKAGLPVNRRVIMLFLLLAVLLANFNINNFYEPAGGWAFLGEEGQFLADAQIILNGGDYARDFFCLYGPLVVYPLAWTMKIFGASVMVGRFYSYGLTLISAVILVTVLNRTIRNRVILISSTLLMGALFIGGGGRTNATLLRVFLGFVPLLIIYRHAGSERKMPAVAAGTVLGISLLFSQEVGLCALIATGVFLCLEAYTTKAYRRLIKQCGLVAMGCCLVVLPMLGYMYRQGALDRFFESLYGYPKLVTLGYGSLPFPSFMQFLADPLTGGVYFPYWMIGIYLLTAITLLVLLFLGLGNREIHFRVALLVFGLLLFRAALGRSDESHFFFALPPALLLTSLMFDDAVRGLADCPLKALKTGRRILIGALLLSLVLLFGTSRVLRENIVNVFTEMRRFPSKFTVQETGVALPHLSRGGTFYDPATAADLVKIGNALDRYTKPGDYVLFFPNEAAYYFLFNRSVPTRFVFSYFAITTAQRREMVTELEHNKPQYVVYSLDTWRIDDIPEDVQVPEVAGYLREKYSVAEDLGNILILRRKGP
ncbi:MAG: hypothetical protein JJE30_14810 [Desulfuromonadales bacterium]|nr:hypothetical protein [Desulfuromonadales bacterium]